uniref:Thioesterase family protein n=1 Tax=Streptomyces sp. NBC_00148 TaxID=2903626 RepID=A0AAU1M2T5_9ACTN
MSRASFTFAPAPELDGHPGDPLQDLLDLEEVETDLYRSRLLFADHYALYGGQVAAQALRAAGLTVPPDRLPHSLHSYFLRPGDASRPTVFQVHRDRDGRSYSARRVVAVQDGKAIFTLSASFHAAQEGPDEQVTRARPFPSPEECAPFTLPRLFSMESRSSGARKPHEIVPMRFWARSTASSAADGQLLHACVLTYLSDISSGLHAIEDDDARASASLDHAVWFHRPVRMDDWTLTEVVPHSAAGGRGWYTGSVFDTSGRLVASFTQEALFRHVRRESSA